MLTTPLRLLTLALTLGSLYGCATIEGAKQDATIATRSIGSGTHAGDLPANGTFVASNGVVFTVTELHAQNIPAPLVTARAPLSLPPASKYSNAVGNYQIAPGDVLDIKMPGYPEFAESDVKGRTVDQSGYIQFPMVGRIKAAGLTPMQLSDALNSRLSRYLKLADAQVNITSYRGNRFYIDGEVRTPGEFVIADQPVSIYTAIGMAGGATTENADTENITLVRNGRTYQFGLKSAQRAGYSPNNIMIRNGDAIHVGDKVKRKITVIGEFGKQEPVEIPEDGISLASVIGEASGLQPTTANARKVYVLRENPYMNTAHLYYTDLTTITNFAIANRFKMQAGDIVYVDPTGLTRWNRILNLILPSVVIPQTIRQF